MKRYAETHEWIDGDDGTVGISAHAVEMLGDIVFLELPTVGQVVARGDSIGVIESVKAASDIYAPVSGEVVEVNQGLVDAPETLADAPETWMVKIRLADANELDQLMDAEIFSASLED